VRGYPQVPRPADAPARLFEQGHLWVLEHVDGGLLRFQLREDGSLRFGDRTTVYGDAASVPLPDRAAVRYVREHLDREALRAAVDDPGQVVFFAVSTHRRALPYEFDRLPPALGLDIWDGDRFLTPDAVHQIFEQLGLEPVPAIERELPARDFDPDRYTVPESAWYDGPAAGVVVCNKRGDRTRLLHPEFRDEPSVTVDGDAESLAAAYTTRHLFDRLVTELQDHGQPVTVDTLSERALEVLAREHHHELYLADDHVDMRRVRAAVTELAREFLEQHHWH